jgi:hypothetical protein
MIPVREHAFQGSYWDAETIGVCKDTRYSEVVAGCINDSFLSAMIARNDHQQSRPNTVANERMM